jgi:hypothetical protein
MQPRSLVWVAVMIVGSSLYAVLVAWAPDVASAIMLGYVALLLTIFVANELRRKHNGQDRSGGAGTPS